ncbi:MAG: helix-turn-helix domain-containing protein [Spirochaetes bacterium]|nr:helix-turn-helix domain-containing protein [Spirochaetota bacterium]
MKRIVNKIIKNNSTDFNEIKKRKIHIKIFNTIILSISISIIILSIVLYAYFEKVILSRIFESEKNNLYQASVSIKFMQDLSKNLAIQIYNDYTLSGLLYVPEEDPVNLYHALTSFKKYHNLISYIHSIYIYNYKNNNFYITSPANTDMIQNADTFFDYGIFEYLKNSKYINSLIPLPRIIREPEVIDKRFKEKGVYTFIFNLLGPNDYKKSGAVVINISENWLRNIIDSLDVKSDNKAFIIDRDDRLLISYSDKRILSKASIYDHLKSVVDNGTKKNYLTLKLGREKYFIVFHDIESFGWMLIKQIPYKELMGFVTNLRINLIIISIILLVIGILTSYLLSKRLYLPIDNLLKELKILEDKRKSDSYIFKKYNLKQILEQSNMLNEYELNGIIKDLSIDYEENDFIFLLLIEIDKYKEFINNYSSSEQNLLKLGILNEASKIINKKYCCEGINLEKNQEVLLINIKEDEKNLFEDKMKQLSDEIQNQIEKALNISLTIVISPKINDVKNISEIYKKVIDMSKYKFLLGYKSVILEKNINFDLNKNYTYPVKKIDKFIDSINQGNIDSLSSAYNEIISYATDYGLIRLKLTINDIANRIAKTVNIIKSYNYFNDSFKLNDFFSKINESETLTEINTFFNLFFDELMTAVKKRNKTKKHSLISEILETIDKDYMDINLSISSFADKYNLSAAYLGRLFYKFNGISMSEYINKVRINKAKEFLENNKFSIFEIMKMVGFTNKTHFYNMFKKYNTVTPNEYRHNINN